MPRDAVEIKASIGGGPDRAGIEIRGEEIRAFRVVALVVDSIFGDCNKRIKQQHRRTNDNAVLAARI